jgi:hypothetical protein
MYDRASHYYLKLQPNANDTYLKTVTRNLKSNGIKEFEGRGLE